MASINAVLTAENGDDLYPETYDDYVLDSNGEALSTRLGSRSEASGVSGTSAFEKINTLNSDLASKKYNKISAQVTLTGLYTEANPYTFPNDGYLRLSIGAAATTVYYKLMGAAGSTSNVPEMTITSDSGRVLLYVRAGMRWGVSSGNEDKLTAVYAPLNYA